MNRRINSAKPTSLISRKLPKRIINFDFIIVFNTIEKHNDIRPTFVRLTGKENSRIIFIVNQIAQHPTWRFNM